MIVKEEHDLNLNSKTTFNNQISSKPQLKTFESIDSQTSYALKMINFSHLNQEKLIEHLNNEKRVLLHLQNNISCNNSYFPRIYATFTSKMHANLLLEHILGTNLH